MSKNRYYYYDHQECTFVEVKPSRASRLKSGFLFTIGVLVCGVLLAAAWSFTLGTPQELALKYEKDALKEQLSTARSDLAAFSDQLAELVERDQNLYRVILDAEQLPSEVLEMGVGGVDPYASFNVFRSETREVLKGTSEELDKLSRQLEQQRASTAELMRVASERKKSLAEWPSILPVTGRIVSGYGMRMHPIEKVRKLHAGIDIVVNVGTPVSATANGIVTFVGRRGGYGYTVEITHRESGHLTRYAHLSRKKVKGIRKGVKVTRGQHIAFSGNSGLSAGPHLHYEVRDLTGASTNPVEFFSGMTPEEYHRLKKEAEEAVSPLD